MKIVLLESCIVWENRNKNIEIFEQDLDEISRLHETDIVCLPEMSFTGFSMNAGLTKDVEHITICRMQELSKKYHTMPAFGWVDETSDGFENHYSIVTPDGLGLDYQKIHPFAYGGEAAVFTAGTQLRINYIRDFCVGIQICYDLRFPETFQILSKKAELIIVPANWPRERVEHWDVLLRARAIENQVYLAGINCRGVMNGVTYGGHSVLIAPDGSYCEGERVILGSKNQACIYEIHNDTADFRKRFPAKQDRRESLYDELAVNMEKM